MRKTWPINETPIASNWCWDIPPLQVARSIIHHLHSIWAIKRGAPPVCLGVYVGDEILPSYVGIISKTMKYKDPSWTTRIRWKVRQVFFRGSYIFHHTIWCHKPRTIESGKPRMNHWKNSHAQRIFRLVMAAMIGVLRELRMVVAVSYIFCFPPKKPGVSWSNLTVSLFVQMG